MSRVHILETEIPNAHEDGDQPGSMRVIYHVPLDPAKIKENLDLSVRRDVGSIRPTTRLQGGTVRVGPSMIPDLLGTHPDFGETLESVLLSQQKIAEVECQVQRNENEPDAASIATAAGFYSEVASQAQGLYDVKFGLYATATDDTPE